MMVMMMIIFCLSMFLHGDDDDDGDGDYCFSIEHISRELFLINKLFGDVFKCIFFCCQFSIGKLAHELF